MRRGITYAEFMDRRDVYNRRLRRLNAERMYRIAARLPACVLPLGECPLHKHEAPSPARDEASTTVPVATRRHDGCYSHGTD